MGFTPSSGEEIQSEYLLPRRHAVEAITAELEDVLAPFQMRPHWGKLFHMNAATIATLYERHGDFVRLQERLDRRGAFRNQWLQSHVLGNA